MKNQIVRLSISFILFVLPLISNAQKTIDICADGPVQLRAGNFQHGTIQWESSVDNVNWEAIPNAYDTIYSFTPEKSMYYRVVNKQFNCPPAYSQVTFVQIPPTAKAGIDRVVNGNEVTLFANTEERAQGTWSVFSGSNVSFSDSTDNNAVFQGSEPDYILVWTLTNSCGTSQDTINISFRDNTYAEKLVVVDETDTIKSTTEQLEAGLYIIAFNDPVPVIGDSTYLVGIPDGGFLRMVESFTVLNNTYTIHTSQATLEEITDEGAFDFGHLFSIDESIDSTMSQGLKSATLKKSMDYDILDHIPTRGELLTDPKFKSGKFVYVGREQLIPQKEGIILEKETDSSNQPLFNFHFPNVKLTDAEEELFEIILSGNYSFTPNMVFDIDYSGFRLNYFKMGLDNALEELDISLNTTAQLTAYELLDREFSLFSISKHFVFVIGAVPVVVEIKIDLKGEVSADIGAEMSFDYNYNRKKYFTANIEYSDQQWKRYYSNPPAEVSLGFNSAFTGNATEKFKIGPEISFKLYKIVGPYIELQVKQEAEICASLGLDWNAGLELGGELKLGAKAEILKKTLFDTYYSWEQGIYSYKFPYSMEIVSGNNQSYVPGQALAHNAKIKVSSNKGVQLPLAKVVFEPQNGGSVSKSIVLADQKGFAETSWTPGGAENSRLNVSVFDCQGNHILNSPLTFYATTESSNCSQSTLSLGIEKTGGTIQPKAYLGVPPYEYSTDGITYQTSIPSVSVLPGTLYTFYVKDDNQCIASKTYNERAVLTPPLTLSAAAVMNRVEAQAEGGTLPYEYSLDDSTGGFTGSNVFENVPNGEHIVYAKDANNTIVSKQVTVNYQSSSNEFTDSRDGNTYQTVTIGSQTWMAENLAWLPGVSPASEGSYTDPYYYVYGYEDTSVSEAKATGNYETYGVLYNWPAALTACPSGWHLPTDAEWTTLTDYLINNGYGYGGSGSDIAKSLAATSGWTIHSTPGTVGNDQASNNSSGFDALPSGYRSGGGYFDGVSIYCSWWTASGNESSNAWFRDLNYNHLYVGRVSFNREDGYSVRCLKDDNSATSAEVETLPATDITETTATLNGEVTDDGGATVTERGFCYSTSPGVDIDDTKVLSGSGTGTFNETLTGLQANTTYYVKAYAINSVDTAYGDEISFTTDAASSTSFTDSRDGHIYQTVTIGTQTWMAENLAWLPSVSPSSAGSYTDPYYYVYGYEDTSVSEAKATGNYEMYGVLYNWPAALTACPSADGWHLPTDAEWTTLTDYLTNNGYGYEGSGSDIAKSLAATSGWTFCSTPGTVGNDQISNNTSGFGVLPGGGRGGSGYFGGVGGYGYWWSASENGSSYAWLRGLYYYDSDIRQIDDTREDGFSVRCVKD
ncbi:MAG TPA: FISUMP domain-containing protein [Prolixibacteraceae bacterium]|nr:FISUMP domain-containing protein [Prolixibacteraceae bacterium]